MPGIDVGTIITGAIIFLARVVDVSLGTIRTISIVRGRTSTAFFLGFIEIIIWLAVIAAVLNDIMTKPLLGVFYAFGFSTGNVVGIMLERRVAFGHIVLQVISSRGEGAQLATAIRDAGYGVTTFEGQGMSGPVTLLYLAARRKDVSDLLAIVKREDPDAFYILELASSVSKIQRPMMPPATGWRAVFKKK